MIDRCRFQRPGPCTPRYRAFVVREFPLTHVKFCVQCVGFLLSHCFSMMRVEASFSLQNGQCDAQGHRDILEQAIRLAGVPGRASLQDIVEGENGRVRYRISCASHYTFQLLMHALMEEGRVLQDLAFNRW